MNTTHPGKSELVSMIEDTRSWMKSMGIRPSVRRVVERCLVKSGYPEWQARSECRWIHYAMPLGSNLNDEAYNILAKKLTGETNK